MPAPLIGIVAAFLAVATGSTVGTIQRSLGYKWNKEAFKKDINKMIRGEYRKKIQEYKEKNKISGEVPDKKKEEICASCERDIVHSDVFFERRKKFLADSKKDWFFLGLSIGFALASVVVSVLILTASVGFLAHPIIASVVTICAGAAFSVGAGYITSKIAVKGVEKAADGIICEAAEDKCNKLDVDNKISLEEKMEHEKEERRFTRRVDKKLEKMQRKPQESHEGAVKQSRLEGLFAGKK